jgi:hypothetical protein
VTFDRATGAGCAISGGGGTSCGVKLVFEETFGLLPRWRCNIGHAASKKGAKVRGRETTVTLETALDHPIAGWSNFQIIVSV